MSNTTAKETQKQIRAQAREVFNRLDQATKSEGVTLTTNENGVPVPKDWPEALDSIREYLNQHDQLFRLVLDLKALLPETDEKESLDRDEFESMFLTGLPAGDIFDAMIGMSPPKIALIAIDHFLKDSERFEIINPNSLEFAKDCERPYLPPKITHTSFEMGSKTHSVPVNGEYWVLDKKLNEPFIITYGPTPNGGISCQLQANYEQDEKAGQLMKEIRDSILLSPFIRGQILEMEGGSDFKVVDIGAQPYPVLDETVKAELEKNVINMFTRKEEFEKYNLPVKRSVILAGPPGCGKCLAKGTPVLMHDGTIKKVEDVRVGDLLMGDDSKPRAVLSLARGTEAMYRVTPTKGDPYTVNESHILSLRQSSGDSHGEVVDISIRDYLALPEYKRERLKGYRAGVEFSPGSRLPLDPYFLGLWLGDGNSREPWITTADPEVVQYLTEFASAQELNCRAVEGDSCGAAKNYALTRGHQGGHIVNPIMQALRAEGLILNKHIPHKFKTASRNDRLSLLAGLIDSDGHNHSGVCDFISKDEVLADDVIFLSRSLGFAAYKNAESKCASFADGSKSESRIYYRVSISGELSFVPTKVARKRFEARKQIKNVLVTGVNVEPIGVDRYYGFEIDGNRRFLLGDFTVTHNTMIERWLATELKGKVTTIWVTAKSIRCSEDVQAVFEIARKLSPALVVMEDLDLVSGTRSQFGQASNCLGEMLNQLDGLTQNESLVLVGSTNNAGSLDAALSERPGRFDRIYEVGCPKAEHAKIIAQNYLRSHGVAAEIVDSLSLKCLQTGNLTGAQIVEIVKGGIFEAVHRSCEVSDACIANSARGLEDQRRVLKKG